MAVLLPLALSLVLALSLSPVVASARPAPSSGPSSGPEELDVRSEVSVRAPAPPSSTSTTSSGVLCVEKASAEAFDGVVALQDGSGRLLCWRRSGQIWLGAVDVDPSGRSVLRVGSNKKPFIDVGPLVSQAAAARGLGLAGVAVHHDPTGGLFLSYYTTVDKDGNTSTLLVVEQLSPPSWSGGYDKAQATSTRVFSMALPDDDGFLLDSYYAGQILFRPNNTDPFIYLVTAPSQSDDARILRFLQGGNDTVTPMSGHTYAAGLGIPRRCSFDADRPHDMYCAILKDDQELVYLISDPDGPSSSSATPQSVSLVVAHQRPTPGTPPSLIGGLLYRGHADDTITGSYIYLEDAELWQTVGAAPAHSYTIAREVRVACSARTTTTSPCRGGDFVAGVVSFGEDVSKNALLIASDGIYMIVSPSLCGTPHDNTNTTHNWVIGVVACLAAALATYGASKCCSGNGNQTNNQEHNSGCINNGNIFISSISTARPDPIISPGPRLHVVKGLPIDVHIIPSSTHRGLALQR